MRNIDNNMVAMNHSFWVELDVDKLNLAPLQPNFFIEVVHNLTLSHVIGIVLCWAKNITGNENCREGQKPVSHTACSWIPNRDPFGAFVIHSMLPSGQCWSIGSVVVRSGALAALPGFSEISDPPHHPLMVGQWGLSYHALTLPPLHRLWGLVGDSPARKAD